VPEPPESPEPGPANELIELPATELLARFRRQELSPVEYLDAIIERAAVVEPTINAFGDTYFDEARLAAHAAEVRYQRGPEEVRPLEGLPVAVKDEAEIAGKRTTNGSLLWADSVAGRTEPMVERLLSAGAFVHARTLTPEFSVTFWTMSKLWGITRNPWNPAFDVGGSSGGSGAALAAGTTPLATGSDIGGSIRVPASCNGVVGYKPPHGRVPQLAPFGLDHWCHLGPMARTVADAALVLDVVAGFHPDAAYSTRPARPIGSPDADVRGLRVAVSYDLGDWPVVESVRHAHRAAVDVLRTAGALVDEVDLTIERSLVRDASNAHCAALFAASISETIRGREHAAMPATVRWLETVESHAPSFMRGLELEGEIWSRLGRVFDRYDALICPAMCVPALHAGVDYLAEPLVADGIEWDAMHDVFLTEVFNPVGLCPVLTVPVGRDDDAVPIGAQIVGRPFDDATVFAVGARLEADRPWPLIAPLGR
jgi:aspartyl-tRNA(Asn)/glutamyl-tRNA(Gln) amidotransferase subunit A